MTTNTQNFSLYIPRLFVSYTENAVKNIFLELEIGLVSRVDFVPIEFMRKETMQSAFVHFNQIFDYSFLAQSIVHHIAELKTGYRIYPVIHSSEYWILAPNLKPIPETRLNIHQVTENARLLQEKVDKQAAIINEQQYFIEKQSKEISRIQDTIDHLLPKIFGGPENDIHWMHRIHNYMVTGKFEDSEDQGWATFEKYDSEKNDVENDSVPDLISCTETDSNSMPGLVSDSDTESDEERGWDGYY